MTETRVFVLDSKNTEKFMDYSLNTRSGRRSKVQVNNLEIKLRDKTESMTGKHQ